MTKRKQPVRAVLGAFLMALLGKKRQLLSLPLQRHRQ